MDDLSRLADYFERQPDIALAMVFGSFGTSRARRDSDLDVAVLASAALSTDRRMSLIDDLSALTGRTIDLVDLATAGLPILGSVLKTGRVLSAHDPSAHGRLLARYLIDAADFLPYYERILKERRAAWTR
jgi:predicted nucleotidyltransferase